MLRGVTLDEEGATREHGLPYSNIYVTISPFTGIRVAEYPDPSGRPPFHRWFDDLDTVAAAKVSNA